MSISIKCIRGLLLFLFLLQVGSLVLAQEIDYRAVYDPQSSEMIGSSNALPVHLQYRVQSIDDFMARWNIEHNAKGFAYSSKNKKLNQLKTTPQAFQSYKKWLWEELIAPGLKKKESALIASFLEDCAKKDLQLAYYSDAWDVKVPYKMKQGREKIIDLYLVFGVVYEGEKSEWKLKRIESPSDKIKQNCPEGNADFCGSDDISDYISPNSHLVDFIDFDRLLQERTLKEEHILDGDNSVHCFWEYYQNKTVVFEKQRGVFYVFNLGGYQMKVSFFNEAKQHSGWLVSDVIRID